MKKGIWKYAALLYLLVGLVVSPAFADTSYTVKPGDTLSAIARQFNTTVQAIVQRNNIVNPDFIYVGQQLTIPTDDDDATPTTTPPPSTSTPTPQPPGEEVTYRVQAGDTLYRIAVRFNVPMQAIIQRNNIANPNFIYVGQLLVIPGGDDGGSPTSTPPPSTPTPTTTATSGPPTATPTPATATPTPSGNSGFELGGQTHSFANPDVMRNAGMTWVKFQHKWGVSDDPNAVADRITTAQNAGFKVLLSIPGSDHSSINYAAYTDFLGGVAALGPDAIEVWNEQNIDREWPSGQINAADYVNNMLKPAYQKIKAANSNVMVISGAPAPTGFFGGCSGAGCDDNFFVQQMAAAGAANYMDCIGIHYNEGILSPTQTSGDPRGNSDHYTRYFWGMTNTYHNAFGGAKPLCYTELGYLTPEGYPALPAAFGWAQNTTVAQHAQWLGEAATLSKNSGKVRMLIVFNVDFTVYNEDPQAGFAIMRPGGDCPACATLANALTP